MVVEHSNMVVESLDMVEIQMVKAYTYLTLVVDVLI
jgi:hypothetical protein